MKGVFTSPKVKPLYVMRTTGVPQSDVDIVLKTLTEILSLAGDFAEKRTSVHDLGVYKKPSYKDRKGLLIPFKSIEWFVNDSFDSNRDQVNVNKLFKKFLGQRNYGDDWELREHYEVVLTEHDLFSSQVAQEHSLSSATSPDKTTIISLALYQGGRIKDKQFEREVKKQQIYDAAARLFELPNSEREDIDIKFFRDCKNVCAVRHGYSRLKDFISFAKERRNGDGQIYCPTDVGDLREHFTLPQDKWKKG